jgi:F-type H+-transporting ATPase subunit a
VEGLGEKVAELLHELSVLPLNGKAVTLSPFTLTNYMLFLLIAMALTIAFFLIAARKVALVPKGIGNVAEAGVEFVQSSMILDVIGPRGKPYLPFVASMFFFVLFNNLVGLVPGAKPGTGTMGTTATWAIVVFVVYNAIGIKKHGAWGYLMSFYPKGVPAPLAVFVMILELISHFIRPLTLSVRLFANMFAGHVILGIFSIFTIMLFEASGVARIAAVLPLAMQIVMYAFEVFVAFIQAYVFAILTTVYISGAVHAGEH